MISHSQCQFSLKHPFFDALLDLFSLHSSAIALAQIHKANASFNTVKAYSTSEKTSQGDRLSQAHECPKNFSETISIYQKTVFKFGTLKFIKKWFSEKKLKTSTEMLDVCQTAIPSLSKQHYSLVTAAILKQWHHFGPFGFKIDSVKEIVNYNAQYIEKAVLYLDKSLCPDEWLLGYGLSSLSMPMCDGEQTVCCKLDKLEINRPICILDADLPIAYVNQRALKLVFHHLNKQFRDKFSDQDTFERQIKEQGGLVNEQLVWLIDALPRLQIQQQAFNILNSIDEIVNQSRHLGISAVFLNDTHPFALALLEYYFDSDVMMEINNTSSEKNKNTIKAKKVLDYPIAPLFQTKEFYKLAK